ncbi:hypothetical protein [Streptomyces sp. NRRL S-244]|uniref:hypothetical protein n=1 Tax=Streptomyces sp. NRRL S-244 TaxID=1463897 RepID=UPI0004BFE9E2|nr:hypothetical protein [Streptomyces sp. NRRL S-244]
MSVSARYTKELRERFGYSATWLPTVRIGLGDVGRMVGYEFERLGGLADFGVRFEARGCESVGTMAYASSGGVEVTVGGTAEVASGPWAAPAGVAMSIKFSREGAVWFQAEACVVEAIEDLLALESEIVALNEAGKWDDDLVVVTEVIRAEQGTVLVSGGAQGGIDLTTRAEVPAVGGRAGVRVTASRNIGTQVVGYGDLTPLFRAKGIRRRLLRRATLTSRLDAGAPLSQVPEEQLPSVFLGDVDYDHFA